MKATKGTNEIDKVLPKKPAVYRPQPVPHVLQKKTTTAPPVYRPEKKLIQPKCIAPCMPPAKPSTPVVGPKLLRPNQPHLIQHQRTVARSPNQPSIAKPTTIRTGIIQRAQRGPRYQQMEEMPDLPIRTMRFKIAELRSPEVTPSGFFAPRRLSTKQIVDALFREFLGLGVGYELGVSPVTFVLGDKGTKPLGPKEIMRNVFQGNCMALAGAFAKILDEAVITARAVEVRKEQPHRAFVVHCPHFIDPAVPGHIYQDGALWKFHYLFTNHTAVWVPELGVYYDPMAGTTYHNLNEAIVMELQALDEEDNIWKGSYQGREYILRRRPKDKRPPPGSFFGFDMELASPSSVGSPPSSSSSSAAVEPPKSGPSHGVLKPVAREKPLVIGSGAVSSPHASAEFERLRTELHRSRVELISQHFADKPVPLNLEGWFKEHDWRNNPDASAIAKKLLGL